MQVQTVIIAGCGNIGGRLIQSLARVTDRRLNIIGIEPFEKARENSDANFKAALQGEHTLTWAHDGARIPATVDLAVVSCDARHRLDALQNILSSTTPDAILLEKILFTKPDHYRIAQDLITKAGSRCWVNTTRNVWPGYQSLKATLKDTGLIRYVAEGNDWNLGSNAIHFLSVVEYLTDSQFDELTFTPLGIGHREAKRAGYREVVGTLTASTARGDTVKLVSNPDSEPGIRITVETDGAQYKIAEGPQTIAGPDGDGTFRMLHASQLEDTFTRILRDGECDLPTLSESTRLHLLFFDAIAPALGVAAGDEVLVT